VTITAYIDERCSKHTSRDLGVTQSPCALCHLGPCRYDHLVRPAPVVPSAAELAQEANPVGAWQPIETAPLRGVGQFLVYIPAEPDGPIHVCTVCKTISGFMSMIGGLMQWDRDKPTHWMPLPEPPT
jgi:Protein of unknown function (DUF551)